MKSIPKFSFIIPVYNCEKYINRCIDSIINQKHDNIEIIIVNDGSTDNTQSLCEKLSQKYKKIRLINKKNEGVSAARNDALKQAKGDYICFLDADDYLDNNYIENVMKIINDNEKVELINFGFYSETEDNNLKTKSCDKITYEDKVYKNHNDIIEDFINLWDNTMLYNIWNKVYSLKIIKENKIVFPKYNWGEDMQFNRDYLEKVNYMINVNDCYYHYVRERSGAVTKIYKPDIFNIRVNEFKEFNEYFEKCGIDKEQYYEFSCRRYIERVLGCIENIYNSNMKFSDRYKEIKKIINNSVTIETIKYAKPKSKKIKIMLLPIKMKLVLATMLMGRTFNIIKNRFPSLFNKLKNRR